MEASTVVVLCLMAGFLVPTVLGSSGVSCPEGLVIYWLADPEDCSKFHVCYLKRSYAFDCGVNVWSEELKTCVAKGSTLDKCTEKKPKVEETPQQDGGVSGKSADPCSSKSEGVYAKGDNCAQYYDCNSTRATVSANKQVVECEHPLLFDDLTKSCKPSNTVQCGQRKEPLDACDYVSNRCLGRSHCVPCNVRYPSCRDLPDGLNAWKGRENSPSYVICKAERVVKTGLCDYVNDDEIFDAEKRECVSTKN